MSMIKSVVVPGGVKIINHSAFMNCSALQSIALPDGITTIGNNAMRGCVALQSIAIPSSCTYIGDEAWAGAIHLERKAKEQGLSIEEWGRSNWRKAKAAELRYAILSCITKLRALSDEGLEDYLTTMPIPAVGDCVRFVVQCGEEGLVREICRFAA
jgi:hypothetical protein